MCSERSGMGSAMWTIPSGNAYLRLPKIWWWVHSAFCPVQSAACEAVLHNMSLLNALSGSVGVSLLARGSISNQADRACLCWAILNLACT